jgi:hypothetical protein
VATFYLLVFLQVVKRGAAYYLCLVVVWLLVNLQRKDCNTMMSIEQLELRMLKCMLWLAINLYTQLLSCEVSYMHTWHTL